MKIAIFSDTHDNLVTLKLALNWINKEKIEMIIHCGDVSTPATLNQLRQNFTGPIHLVLGNADDNQLKTEKNVTVWSKVGEAKVEKKKIAFTHWPKEARELAKSGKYEMVFYGHTHKPWEERVDNCRLANPGNLAGMFYKATFAIYDTQTNKLELKILEKL